MFIKPKWPMASGGHKVRHDNQPLTSPAGDCGRAGETGQRRPLWHCADPLDHWQETRQHGEKTGEEKRIESEGNGQGELTGW